MNSTRYNEAKKITIIGAGVNALLGIVKLISGILFHSHALIADGLHSFSDLFTDTMVLFASKYGSQDADLGHPYGHQRIETAATFLLALLLILTGSGIVWDALDEIFYGQITKPSEFALPVAIFSIVMNEMLFQYTHRIGLRIQSPLILANAWHHRSDAAASFVVLLGLLGTLLGYTYLDPLAAIIVGFLIIKMGWDYGWNSIKELVDSSVDVHMLQTITDIIKIVPGVNKIHQLRTRSMGGDIYVDVHILVEPYISVSEGHYIAQHVQHALIQQIAAVKDVTVHVDSEDDEIICPSLNSPSRKELETRYLIHIRSQFPDILFYTLHYLDGKIVLDLITKDDFQPWSQLHDCIQNLLSSQKTITDVRLFCLKESISLANSN